MMNRAGLIESFKDTQRMIRTNEDLRDQTLKTRAGTLLYLGGYEAMNPTVKTEIPVIEVIEDTSFMRADPTGSLCSISQTPTVRAEE